MLGKIFLAMAFVIGLVAPSTPGQFKTGVLVMGFELFRLFRGGDATSQPKPAETPPGAGVQRPSFGRRVSGPVPVPPLSPPEPTPSPAAAEEQSASTPSAPSPPAAEEQSAPTPSSPGPPAAEEQGAPTLSRPASPATEDRSAPTLKAFEPELQRLDLYQRGLGAAAIRYVANGEDSSLPRRVAALVAAVPRYQGPYHSDTKAKGEAAAIANLALMRPEIPAGHVARFLQLRLLVDPLQTPYGQPPLSEERQLIRAVFNAVRAALPKSVSDNDKTPCEQARSLRQMNELVRHCGGNMVDLFENLLGHDSAYYIVPGAWIEGSDCAEYMRNYPMAVATVLPGLTPRHRIATLKVIEHHGCVKLPEILTALIAMLSKPYGQDEREAAISTLARLDAASLRDLIAGALPAADIETRHGLVQAAGRNNAPELLELLRERAKVEKAAKVRTAIEALLEGSSHDGAGSDEGGGDAGSYAAVTGEMIALPPLPADLLATPGKKCRRVLDELVELLNAERAAVLAKGGERQQWQLDLLQPITPEVTDSIFAWLRGEPASDNKVEGHFYNDFKRSDLAPRLLDALGAAPPNFALRIAAWMAGKRGVGHIASPDYFDRNSAERLFLSGCVERGLDLRVIAALASRPRWTEPFDPQSVDALVAKDGKSLRQMLKGDPRAYVERAWRNPLDQFPPETVWPWLVENLAIFDEALGLAPATEAMSLSRTLTVLEQFPAVPQRYYARIVEIAVSEKRPLRRQAMALLKGAKDLDKRLEALLDDSRQPVRINAATWLADMRATKSEGALRKRLRKEKSEPVRTALIEALQRLDADLSEVMSPASLLAQAKSATAKGAPEMPDWLPIDSLPAASFADGTPAPTDLIRYWLSVAIKLKDPSATGQFGLYLDQLRPEDARALSGWVLDHWIAYDTHSPSLDEANAYATKHAETTWQSERRWYPNQTLDQVFDRLRRERQSEMPNSGAETKGMLALACRADPVWAAQRVRWFLKNHGRRSNQAMALLDMLAGIESPVALQVVIAASVRLKQKSTQKHAAEIAERYAEDRGWSVDELADRTVPAAGFDDDGVLALPCGEDEKPYVAQLDAQLVIHLFNPEGKSVKALPAGDDEATKESKKALTGAKKELKQVVDMQSARLFEAMCVERSWPVADWRGAFHEHPVMRRLIERLVWQGLDSEGAPLGLFRPTQEGDFTDAADNAVDVDTFARLRLAHGALVDGATCKAWLAHLRDYEVRPLIAQFGTTRAPLSDEQGETVMIEDRKGWIADSRTYRGLAEKRGYERSMGDGGGCNEYEKAFQSLGLIASIHHSGSHAVDENNLVALKGLSFRKAGQYSTLKLKDVPPVMLAECWADFHALAEKGAFDPEWEKKAPW